MTKKKIYIATTFQEDKRSDMHTAIDLLRNLGFEVYAPVEHIIPNAWDYPNDEWGLMVFEADVEAIKQSDYVVMLSYGRESNVGATAGTNWEAGFAFGIGKKVIVVEMTDNVMSLMVANGRYATVKGLSGLKNYDWKNLPQTRTKTEQK